MKDKSLKILLYIVPFANIIGNRISDSASLYFLILLLSIYLLFSRSRKLKISRNYFLCTFVVSGIVMLCLLLLTSIIYDIGNIYYIRFYGLFICISFLFLVKGAAVSYYYFLPHYIKYLIYLITISIAVDFSLMSCGMIELQPMFNIEQYSYHTRPFGIFGQPSVNSSLLCFLYLFYNSLYNVGKSKKDVLFIVVTIGCLLQGSGSGFLSYFFVLLYKYGTKKHAVKISGKLILFFILSFVTLGYLILSNKVEKISLNYIKELYEFCVWELWFPYVFSIRSIAHVLWGVPNTDISIDLGPLFIISTVGIVYFTYLTFVFFFLLKKSKQLSMKFAILLLLVANLHYPVMFYFIMNFLWFYIFYHIIVEEQSRVMRKIL